MTTVQADPARIRAAWEGRISGCMLGKPVEVLSFREGRAGLAAYLAAAGAWPLRDYVPLIEGTLVEETGRASCAGHMVRAEPDDDIMYTVLALMVLEDRGLMFETADVARMWLRLVPGGATWTAERAAYRTLLDKMDPEFVNGAAPGFDLDECSDNEYNEWIGGQIRADLYGWVCPGRPALAARLAVKDASLSHRGEGLHGAAFVAALGAAIPASDHLDDAIDAALDVIPRGCAAAEAVHFGRGLAGSTAAVDQLHFRYRDLSPVHTVNNLALVVWALCAADGDFGAAVGDAVAAGWDTDCNGATVGGLFGLTGRPIPEAWTRPWSGRVGVSLAGYAELQLGDLVDRTAAVAAKLGREMV